MRIETSEGKGNASAAAFVPPSASLESLRAAAAGCQGCDLFRYATQTVFGEGPRDAALMFVGEQPGDAEDRAGRPFVGPAGKLLHAAMIEAGIAPDRAYITNTVKHFKFIERGKRRIHATPKRIEIVACVPWLESEIETIEPALVVALGATAAQAFFGPSFRLTKHRGEVLSAPLHARVLSTLHPASILRATDAVARADQRAVLVDDLRVAAAAVNATS